MCRRRYAGGSFPLLVLCLYILRILYAGVFFCTLNPGCGSDTMVFACKCVGCFFGSDCQHKSVEIFLVHYRIFQTTGNVIIYSRMHGTPTPENSPGCRPTGVSAESEKRVTRRHGRLNLPSNPIEIALGDTVCLLAKVCLLRSATLSEVEGRKSNAFWNLSKLAKIKPKCHMEGRTNDCFPVRRGDTPALLCLNVSFITRLSP